MKTLLIILLVIIIFGLFLLAVSVIFTAIINLFYYNIDKFKQVQNYLDYRKDEKDLKEKVNHYR